MKTRLPIFFLFVCASLPIARDWIIDFNKHKEGTYTSAMAYMDFRREPKKANLPNAEIRFDALLNKNVLRLKYPKGCLGTSKDRGCAAQTHFYMPAPHDTLWLSYKLLFEDGFDFKKGGKLPGFCGGKCYTGGHAPSDGNGWSARIMWRENGLAEQYVYHSNQKGKYGDSFPWLYKSRQVQFKTGKWHHIVSKLALNEIRNGIVFSNGRIETWLDGQKVLQKDSITFRKNSSVHISELYFSTFHGGGTDSWSPNHDSYARFSDFIISTDSISTANHP